MPQGMPHDNRTTLSSTIRISWRRNQSRGKGLAANPWWKQANRAAAAAACLRTNSEGTLGARDCSRRAMQELWPDCFRLLPCLLVNSHAAIRDLLNDGFQSILLNLFGLSLLESIARNENVNWSTGKIVGISVFQMLLNTPHIPYVRSRCTDAERRNGVTLRQRYVLSSRKQN